MTPATSISVEHLFSIGRLLLPYVRNRMRSQTTRSLLCLRSWIEEGLVRRTDSKAAAQLPEIDDEETDYEMEEGWDYIELDEAD